MEPRVIISELKDHKLPETQQFRRHGYEINKLVIGAASDIIHLNF